jgi:hypothetical protein
MASVGSSEMIRWHLPLGIWGDQLDPVDIRKWLITDPPRWEAPNVSPMVTLRPLRDNMFPTILEAMTFPCPPTPVIITLYGSNGRFIRFMV